MPQVSAAVLRSTPSSTSASASIRRAAALFFSPLAALRSSEAVRSSRVIDTAAPIDAAPCVYRKPYYYNAARTHLSVNKDAPLPRTIHAVGHILTTASLGGSRIFA